MVFSKRQQNRARQRKIILDAATSLFGADGFDAVTMTDIAAKAGVVRATVFNYFPTKHSLVEAITEDVFAYYTAIIERALQEEDASVPALAKTLFIHMGEGIENASRFYTSFFREVLQIRVGLASDTSPANPRSAALERLEKLMERGQHRGELRADLRASVLARAFDALALGTIIDWLYDESADSLGERMDSSACLFLQGSALATSQAVEVIPGLVPLATTPTGMSRRSAREPS